MKILLILNGIKEANYSKDFFQSYDKIICIDGGYSNLKELNLDIKPDLIIGDFDSIKEIEDLNSFSNECKIFKDNQDETDIEFAIKILLSKYNNINELDMIYCISNDRIDHLLGNILILKRIPNSIKAKIITKCQTIYYLKNNIEINDKKGKTLSIIPMTDVEKIKSEGLKWKLDSINLNFGFVGGISNIVEENNAKISLDKGECAIIIEN